MGRWPARTVEERFWEKVDRSGDCWLWTAATMDNKHGGVYGAFRLDSRTLGAHRIAYQLTYGEIPDGLQIDHTCRIELCVKPAHLRLASNKQNQEHQPGAGRNSVSGFRNVYPNKKSWAVRIKHRGKTLQFGTYRTVEEAAEVARLKRLELFTHNDLDVVPLTDVV